MGAVAEGEIFGFTAAAGPDGSVFLNLYGAGRLTGALVGAVAVRRVFGLAAGAEVEGLAGLSVDLVGEGLPVHRIDHPTVFGKRKWEFD